MIVPSLNINIADSTETTVSSKRLITLSLIVVCIVSLFSFSFVSTAYADAASDLESADKAASEASQAYEDAQAKQEEAQAKLDEINNKISELESQLPQLQSNANEAMTSMYKSGNEFSNILMLLLTGNSLEEVLNLIESYEKIASWQQQQLDNLEASLSELNTAKAEAETATAEANAALEEASTKKEEALDAQEEARKAVAAAQSSSSSSSSSSSTATAATSTTWNDEESAKAYIIYRESRGNYSARNGKYYGAYQLTISYLNGDLSPENQDRVAEQYVKNRYGSWCGAATFWDNHGWY